jgi:predicted nucleic-acid-binding Zn-ribbon protein
MLSLRSPLAYNKGNQMQNNPSPCRHCGGSEHYAKEIVAGEFATLLPIGVLHGPKYQIVVCGGCGLTEWFVPGRFLSQVKEKFDRL